MNSSFCQCRLMFVPRCKLSNLDGNRHYYVMISLKTLNHINKKSFARVYLFKPEEALKFSVVLKHGGNLHVPTFQI